VLHSTELPAHAQHNKRVSYKQTKKEICKPHQSATLHPHSLLTSLYADNFLLFYAHEQKQVIGDIVVIGSISLVG